MEVLRVYRYTETRRQLEKKKDHSSVADIIVVLGISAGRGAGTIREVEERRRTENRSVAHAASGDDTIWSFALEACDNITATWYVN